MVELQGYAEITKSWPALVYPVCARQRSICVDLREGELRGAEVIECRRSYRKHWNAHHRCGRAPSLWSVIFDTIPFFLRRLD